MLAAVSVSTSPNPTPNAGSTNPTTKSAGMGKSDLSLAVPASASAWKESRWFHMMIPMGMGGRRLRRGIGLVYSSSMSMVTFVVYLLVSAHDPIY